jgi:hypothetical protein
MIIEIPVYSHLYYYWAIGDTTMQTKLFLVIVIHNQLSTITAFILLDQLV